MAEDCDAAAPAFSYGDKIEHDGVRYEVHDTTSVGNEYTIELQVIALESPSEYAGAVEIKGWEETDGPDTHRYVPVWVGYRSFKGCADVASVSVPASVTYLANEAFMGCTGLTTVTFEGESSLNQIGQYAFQGSGLTSFSMPKTVRHVGSGAFWKCGSLETFTVPEGSELSELSEGAFEDCTSLRGFELPPSLGTHSLGSKAFKNCRSLDISVHAGSENHKVVDGVLYSYDMRTLLWYPPKSTAETFTVPDGVTNLSGHALAYSKFSEVVIPDGCDASAYSFHKSKVRTVSMGNDAEVRYDGAFRDCEIDTFAMGDNARIDKMAFQSCKIGTLTLGDGASVVREGFRGCDIGTVTFGANAKIYGDERWGSAFLHGEIGTIVLDSGARLHSYALKYCRADVLRMKSDTTVDENAFNQCCIRVIVIDGDTMPVPKDASVAHGYKSMVVSSFAVDDGKKSGQYEYVTVRADANLSVEYSVVKDDDGKITGVEAKAVPKDGHVFEKWSDGTTDATIALTDGMDVSAINETPAQPPADPQVAEGSDGGGLMLYVYVAIVAIAVVGAVALVWYLRR